MSLETWFSWEVWTEEGVLTTCFFIFLARIADTTAATLRTVSLIQGRRALAWFFGFWESLIWLLATMPIFANLNRPPLFLAFAIGFATGGYVGLIVESWLAIGRQAVRIFTRTPVVEYGLRTAGYVVTRYQGQGRDGPVHELFIALKRRRVRRLLMKAKELDDACYYTVEDIRESATQSGTAITKPMIWKVLFPSR